MGTGRQGDGPEYERNRAIMLASPGGDICWLCHHGGARTADHVISVKDWPKGVDGKALPGVHAIENLRPAHGTMGSSGQVNRCPTCGRACNQNRGRRPVRPSARSENW